MPKKKKLLLKKLEKCILEKQWSEVEFIVVNLHDFAVEEGNDFKASHQVDSLNLHHNSSKCLCVHYGESSTDFALVFMDDKGKVENLQWYKPK